MQISILTPRIDKNISLLTPAGHYEGTSKLPGLQEAANSQSEVGVEPDLADSDDDFASIDRLGEKVAVA